MVRRATNAWRAARRSAWGRCLTLWVAVGAVASLASPAWAYHPDHPEVLKLIAQGVKIIESDQGAGTRLGAKCLIGYSLLKAGLPSSHARVQEALNDARKAASNPENPFHNHEKSIYDIAIAAIFLCEVAPTTERAAIQRCLDAMEKSQQPGGGWNYLVGHGPPPAGTPGGTHGDISQTQYAVLAYWSADFHGFRIPVKSAERAVNWLIRVQDVSGGWPYHGVDPGNYNRRTQNMGGYNKVSVSVSAAGLSSLYVGGDLLGMASVAAEGGAGADPLPPALRLVKRDKDGKVVVPAIPSQPFQDSQRQGMQFFNKNNDIKVPLWQHYYMYALERYHSFREIAEGRDDPEPAWYNAGVEYIKSSFDKTNNIWPTTSLHGAGVDAAFTILFLTRSTKKAIEHKMTMGELLGGRGLPGDTTNVRIRNGRVVALEVSKSLDDLVELLEGEENGDEISSLVFSSDDLNITSDQPLTPQKTSRLRRLAAHPSYQVRLLAIKALARTDNLDNAPTLIYGLSDPDFRVIKQADSGLRQLSRRLDGFGTPSENDKAGRAELIRQWKLWYETVRPGGFAIEAEPEPGATTAAQK